LAEGTELGTDQQTRARGSFLELIMISIENFHCCGFPIVFLALGLFLTQDSKNKLTPLSCGNWEFSEKLIDTGGWGEGRGRLHSVS
jgi:hypothetical protein